MRKLESKADENKRRKRNSIIVGLILVAVMFFSVIGFGFQTQDNENSGEKNKILYNGLEFINNGAGYWVIDMGEFQFFFRNTPDQTNDTDAEIPAATTYTGKVLYVYSQNQEAEREIYNNFQNIYLRSQYACLDLENNTGIETISATECNVEYPIKTCSDNFIIIEEKEKLEIKVVDNCVFIWGPKEELVSNIDEFIFRSLEIK